MHLTDNEQNLIPVKYTSLKKVIGQKIKYLKKSDIDRTGRGYYFPRNGTIVSVKGKNIELESGDWLYFDQIEEIVLLKHYKPQS